MRGENGRDDMTTEPPDPPDGDEHEGEDLGRISDSKLPPELETVQGDEGAVLFIPEGTDTANPLNVRVVRVRRADFNDLIARRC